MKDPPAWLTPERLDALAIEIESFPEHSIRRGMDYAAQGRVLKLEWGDDAVSARVIGRQPYRTNWLRTGRTWKATCTCPVAPDCKHAYALACTILAEALPLEEIEASGLDELLPERLLRTTRRTPARRGWAPAPPPRAPRVARDAAAWRKGALERLRTATSQSARLFALSELVGHDPQLALAVRLHPFPDIVDIGDPDIRCLLVAREAARRARGPLPPELASYLERPDLDERLRELARQALSAKLAAWAAPRSASRSLRFVFGIAREGPDGLVVTLEVRLTSPRLRDERRRVQQLRQLANEARYDPELVDSEQLVLLQRLLEPAVAADVFGMDGVFRLSTDGALRLLLDAAGTPHALWGAGVPAELATRAGLQPGAPVRLGSGTVEIGPVLDGGAEAGGDGARIVLGCRLPDGRLLGADERVVLRDPRRGRAGPTLVLAQGACWTTRGDPPPPLPEIFEASGGLPLADPRARALLGPLARRSAAFRATLAAHSRVLPAHPAACLELRDDDWLHVSACAPSAPDWRPGALVPPEASLFEWWPDVGWVAAAARPADVPAPAAGAEALQPIGSAVAPVEASTLPAGSAGPAAAAAAAPAQPATLIDVPDPARVEPLAAWLESLCLSAEPASRAPAGDRDEPRASGGWLRLTARNVEDFVAAWTRRPPGVAWYGNAAVRRLLDPTVRLVPRLRVEPSGVDWFKVSVEWDREGQALGEDDLARLRGGGPRFVRLDSGWASREHAQAQDGAADLLAELGLEAGAAYQTLSVWQLAQARPGALDALEATAGKEALAGLRLLRERIAAFRGVQRVPVPRAIRGELRPYQREGLDFLACTATLGLGAVLADDMGLGKTLQALAWLAWLAESEPGGGPSLVVCPASVVHNWQREAARFAPGLRVLALTSGVARRDLRRRIPEHDLVVTNYALLRRDSEDLGAVAWRAAILDEAQNVKNPDAQVSRAARTLQARHRLALTGTPLENRALDLWSLMAFVNPGYLGARAAFERTHDRADAPPHARRLLAARLRPVMLRRLKVQVAPELPARIEEQRDCEMTEGQRKLYLAELARGRELLGRLDGEGGLQRNRISILAVLTRLRQVCCHPALAGGRAALGSGKFEALFELLEPLLAEGHKVLVFSQFVECLKLLQAELRARDVAFHVLTGASRKRAEIVAAFEHDARPAVFLISLKAGGTGLNLTAASYVVLFDPWWNPAVEAQAIDRTHRIGQDRTVIAYRLVARGTIEERIRELQERKAALVRDVVGEEGFGKALSREDLDYLLAEP